MKKFDAIIIGFGKGGKTLAGKLAARGDTVAMIERSDRMYGGTCINVGCIPSKSLIKNARFAALSKGSTFEEKAQWYKKAIAEKRELTAMLRKKNFDKLNDLPNVIVLTGEARFLSDTQVEVDEGGNKQVLEGEKIFINTGSSPVFPPIEGLSGNPCVYTSEGMMELDILPRKLAIIGGGYIGTEFASMYAGFGSKVTVLQDGETYLPREDEDVAQEVRKILENKGVEFRLGAQIHSVSQTAQGVALHMTWNGEENVLEADAVLVATGRQPNTRGLALEAAGVEQTERGAVKTDKFLCTTAPNIWAMGDVAGGLQFTYISLDDFRIVWSQAGEGPLYTANDRKNVPNSVFIDPPLSTVGLREKEARAQNRNIRIAKLPAAAVPKAQALKETEGFLKAVVDADTDEILGASLICAESHEVINTVKLAIDSGLKASALHRQVFTHPTMSEALNDLFAPIK